MSIDYSDSTPDVAFTYDRLGRQLTVTDILGTRTNLYSPTNLLEERYPGGDALVRSYDVYGRASGIALDPDYSVGYGYDEYGRFSTVAVSNGATFTYSYVPNTSLLAGYTNDLGLAVTYEYDPLRDVKTLVSNAWSTNVISTFAYTYDAIGRRTQRIDDGTTTNLFGYNPRSELVSAEMGTNTYAYAYDPIGNRTETVGNGLTTTYAANEPNQYTALNPASPNPTPFTYATGNRLVADTSPAGANFYDYDGAGRLTNHAVHGRTRAFTYDFTGRMTTLTDTNGSVFAYEFDAKGNRLSQALNDCLATRFVRDGPDVLLELNPANAVVYAWIDGPSIDQPIERLLYIDGAPRARRVFHTDDLGSVAALTNPGGHVTQTYAYSAFGTLRSSSGPDLNRVTYTAREHLGGSQGRGR